MSAAPVLAELRRTLQQRFPDALPLAQGLAASVGTGIGPLDRVLPGGGLARGRVTLWQPGGGATAVLRSACSAAVDRGERSAWVAGGSQLAAERWDPRVLLVRPGDAVAALVCAEELLRCGGFALVVLAGAGAAAGGEAVRLGRAARAGGSAFVLVGTDAAVAHMRLESRVSPSGYRWRSDPFGAPVRVERARLEVAARSLGWSERVRFELPVHGYAQRLALEPALVDRRGARATVRWPRVRRELARRERGASRERTSA
ncbi:MAG TPA: hypothetical protein VK939_08305 [Longimicrobiales bacterium]|nr:hypothetical protein [Longimicrobiales bacterium]